MHFEHLIFLITAGRRVFTTRSIARVLRANYADPQLGDRADNFMQNAYLCCMNLRRAYESDKNEKRCISNVFPVNSFSNFISKNREIIENNVALWELGLYATLLR